MAVQIPVQTWGRLISPNEDEIPAQLFGEMPATVSITMAALDPGEEWANNTGVDKFKGKKPRATIKMIVYPPEDDDDEDEDDETDPDLAGLLDDEDDSDSDDNGEGPSDPNKSRNARLAQAMLGHNADDEPKVNGIGKNKGKGKAVDGAISDDEDEDEEDDEDEDIEIGDGIPDEYVLCTLDPDSHYQQPLNITISEGENVFFRVEGTHSVHLTGNYLAEPYDGPSDDSDDDGEYDLSPDEDELADYMDEDESDELDDVADPRVMEISSEDEEEAPKLVPAKGKNKRAAEPDSESEDVDEDTKAGAAAAIAALEAEAADKPMTKSQLKKLRKKMKDNAGNAVDVTAQTNGTTTTATAEAVKAGAKGDKKVQFAKTLVQGPSGSDASPAAAPKAEANAGKKATLGVKTVQGVTIDDKKLGSGPAAKNGDKVSMRYIGKLEKDKRVFDSNKKGSPFSFKLGQGAVIKGWEIGVAGMQAGGERRITIPAHLAYGSKKMGDIPPNSTLMFDLKLLEIK